MEIAQRLHSSSFFVVHFQNPMRKSPKETTMELIGEVLGPTGSKVAYIVEIRVSVVAISTSLLREDFLFI